MLELLGKPVAGLNGESEVEALQTDVMRFLAIIALCLLAVFAAVSSEMPQSARQMLEVQTQMIEALQADARDTEIQLAELTEQHAEQLAAAASAVARSQLESQSAADDQQHNKNELAILNREIEALSEALNRSDRERRELQQQAAQSEQLAQQQIARLQQQLQAQLAHNRAIKQAIEAPAAADDRPAAVQASAEVSITAVTQRQVTDNPRESAQNADNTEQSTALSLRFENNAALLSLLNSGRVQLIAMADGKAWRFDPRAEAFESTGSLGRVNVISQVPADIGSLAASRTGYPNLRWGVVMDVDLRTRLQQMISRVEGGQIIVGSDGTFIHRR